MAVDAMTYLIDKKGMASSSRIRQYGPVVAVVIIVAAVAYILFRSLFAADVSAAVGSRVAPTLQYVIVVSRHGARGPDTTIPNTPYKCDDPTYWPYGFMELTNVGREQMYELGEKVRSLYNGFLDQFYYNADFEAKSTDKVRTLMSGEVFLAGLYPPKGFQIWNENLLWQPVPVFFTYLDHTAMVNLDLQEGFCPRFKAAQNESMDEFRREYMEDVVSMLEQTQQYSGYPMTANPLTGLYRMWESIYYSDVEGLELPAWTSLIYPEPITSLITKYYTAATVGSFTQTRLLQGTLFKEIMGLLESKINGTTSARKKMNYYSCHDYTIMGIEAIMGMWNSESQFVTPGSALILELHQNSTTGGYYVQVVYIDRRSADLEPKTLDIPGCDFPCDFDRLAAMTKMYYNIEDYDQECQLGT